MNANLTELSNFVITNVVINLIVNGIKNRCVSVNSKDQSDEIEGQMDRLIDRQTERPLDRWTE